MSLLPTWYRRWYDAKFLPWYTRWAPLMVMFCLLVTFAAVVGTWSNYRAQEATRLEQQRTTTTLLKCFDRYTTDLSGVQPAIRRFSAYRDDALKASLLELRDGLRELARGDFDRADIVALVREFNAYERAQDALERGRAANPYPDPPSEFCDLPGDDQ